MTAFLALLQSELDALSPASAEGAISTDPGDLAEIGRDWTKVFEPRPLAIAKPRSTAEVSTILRLANEHGVKVVPSGGRTGLAGGAVAKDGELVLSLTRMTKLGEIDLVGHTLEVEAGAVTQAVHEHCASAGLTWPVDFASKGSSQVGGNIATNAGGIRVIRYGLTRQWVLGLEVVLASGEVLSMGAPLEKNNTGIDLRPSVEGVFLDDRVSLFPSHSLVRHRRQKCRREYKPTSQI